MLFNIVTNDDFCDCIKSVRNAYWPYSDIDNKMIIDLRNQESKTSKDYKESRNIDWKFIIDNKKVVDRYVLEFAAKEKLYTTVNGEAEKFRLPFLEHFHRLFLVRQWNQPYKEDSEWLKNAFTLEEKGNGNFSHNHGNYLHFVNVVAALARLIMYFHDKNNVSSLSLGNCSPEVLHYEGPAEGQPTPNARTFKLMLAAFYHDLGKAIVDPRHAMEGNHIIISHNTSARNALKEIATHHKIKDFDREDLYFLSNLVLFHDHYGTVSTGEDGYSPLVNIIDRMKRYSLKEVGPEISIKKRNEKHNEWTLKYLFDLWLLNVADILTSIGKPGKHKDQVKEIWESKEKSDKMIRDFFSCAKNDSGPEEKGSRLIHDFRITLKLVELHFEDKHTDDLEALQEMAHQYSKRHVTERLRRLITESLQNAVTEKPEPGEAPPPVLAEEIKTLISEEHYWNQTIFRSIRAISDPREFCSRLAWIGKMDYALPFFQQIAEVALREVDKERNSIEGRKACIGNGPEPYRTGWIRGWSGIEPDSKENKKKASETDAAFFCDNYVAMVAQILGYLLLREPSLDHVKNIEFSDAKNRLTDTKIKQILFLEGPARARKAAEVVLDTIYMYSVYSE